MALVGLIMGSQSDWETMRHAAELLTRLGVPFEARVVSAHRTPDLLFEYAGSAEGRGLKVLIAGAGGAAHLPGMAAAKTVLPVLGVPVKSSILNGVDSLLSIVQMPAGVPVGTLAIGEAGAKNAALLAAAILATHDDVVTFEFENIPAQTLQAVSEIRPVHPSPDVLDICRHRLHEKDFLSRHGFPVTNYCAVYSEPELAAALGEIGTPAVLKTAD